MFYPCSQERDGKEMDILSHIGKAPSCTEVKDLTIRYNFPIISLIKMIEHTLPTATLIHFPDFKILLTKYNQITRL